MLKPGMSKSEIEKAIEDKGDFVKIDWLTRFLKKGSPSRDIRIFVYQKLAEIYEKKFLYGEAAEAYENIGMNMIRYTDKIKYYMKEAEIWILKGEFEKTDKALRRALNEANAAQKKEIYSEMKNLYLTQAKKYEKNMKTHNALRIYEKLNQMGLEDSERREVREKLIELYEKFGKFKDAEKIRNLMG